MHLSLRRRIHIGDACLYRDDKNWTTTFCEAGTLIHPEVAAEALKKIGLRGILGRWTWDLPPAPETMKQTTHQALKANENFLEMIGKLSDNKIAAWPLILGMGTASEELMKGAKALADHLNSHGHDALFKHSFYGDS